MIAGRSDRLNQARGQNQVLWQVMLPAAGAPPLNPKGRLNLAPFQLGLLCRALGSALEERLVVHRQREVLQQQKRNAFLKLLSALEHYVIDQRLAVRNTE